MQSILQISKEHYKLTIKVLVHMYVCMRVFQTLKSHLFEF